MKFFNVVKNENGNAEIEIYTKIGESFWAESTSAKSLIREIKRLKINSLTLRINSPGGSVYDGITIYNYLKNSDIKVDVIIDGIAASIASIIALAGDTRSIALGGMIMIHKPAIDGGGNADELRKNADTLDRIQEQMLDIYESNTSLERDEIEEMLNEETWITAKEARKFGFVDEVMNDVEAAACDSINDFDYKNKSKYENFLNNINNQKPNNYEVQMKTLLAVMNCKDETSAIEIFNDLKGKVSHLETSNEVLETKNLALLQAQNEQKIELAILNKQISPAQKDFALQCLNQSEEMYNSFIKTNSPNVPSDQVNIENGENPSFDNNNYENLTYEDLMNDLEKFEDYQKNKPELFEKLKNESKLNVKIKGGK